MEKGKTCLQALAEEVCDETSILAASFLLLGGGNCGSAIRQAGGEQVGSNGCEARFSNYRLVYRGVQLRHVLPLLFQRPRHGTRQRALLQIQQRATRGQGLLQGNQA